MFGSGYLCVRGDPECTCGRIHFQNTANITTIAIFIIVSVFISKSIPKARKTGLEKHSLAFSTVTWVCKCIQKDCFREIKVWGF